MTDTNTAPHIDENHLIAERRAKLTALRGQGVAFPNDFRRGDFAGDLQDDYADADTWTGEALEASGRRVAIGGVNDQLRQHRVVERRHLVAGFDPAVDAGH